ncbi:MAG: STAS/SEC14 domain-containing protein [Ekhidna sp.]
MPVSTINHKNREILYVDFSNLKKKDPVMDTLNDWVKAYKESEKEIYLLLDVRDAFNDPEVMEKMKHYGKTVFKGKSRKRAVVGIKGAKKLLLRGYKLFTNTDISTFDTVEEAKEYLAS